jgi:hypothetical protein
LKGKGEVVRLNPRRQFEIDLERRRLDSVMRANDQPAAKLHAGGPSAIRSSAASSSASIFHFHPDLKKHLPVQYRE